MKEILVNSPAKLRYNLYVEGVKTDADGQVLVSVNSMPIGVATRDSLGSYSISLPYIYNSHEGTINTVWAFVCSGGSYSVTIEYNVVQPYVDWDQFETMFTENNMSYQDFLEAERIARYIINGYCNQSFGKVETTYFVDGTGDDGLILPQRLLVLNELSWDDSDGIIYADPVTNWQVTPDGWVVRRQDEYRGLTIGRPHNPRFRRNTNYSIHGLWGYESVPSEISLCAKMLVESYVCPDDSYRNRYIDNIKSGEWRIEYSEMAWEGTGNANVDEILKDFRLYPVIGII